MKKHFSDQIRSWYKKKFRVLPWRETVDPYVIWVSEVILQQTRVDQGLPYFQRFIKKFPTVKALADSNEDEVLKIWQGLGYYSRARNLLFAARTIRNSFNGQFPETYESILSLKGVGSYTAAAVASISFNQPYPVLDGNVYRVLSRYTGNYAPINISSSKKIFMKLAGELLDPLHAAEHNQAIMELGAMVCNPSEPRCVECPVQLGCFAFEKQSWKDLPVTQPNKATQTRYLNYLVFTDDKKVLMQQRVRNDIWKGLFEFVLCETKTVCDDFEELLNAARDWGLSNELSDKIVFKEMIAIKHKLTHRILQIRFWILQVDVVPENLNMAFAVDIDEINHTFALPKPIEQFLVKLQNRTSCQ